MDPRRGAAVAALAAVAAAALAVGPAGAEHVDPVVYASEPTHILVDDARWTLVEAHAPADGRFEGHATLAMDRPPARIRTVFALLDEDGAAQAFASVVNGPHSAPGTLRADAPPGDDRRIRLPGEGAVDRGPDDTERAGADWILEGDDDATTLVGYLAVLTEDDHPTLRFQAPDGWFGDHTQGARGVQVREVRGFDEVGLHAKAPLEGPSLTEDAREERSVDATLVGAMDLTPGRGEASAGGPAGSTCGGPCPHRTALSGPAGDYAFHVQRHVQVTGAEPWVVTADVERP